ncbi:MAG: M48 family metallopeptidase [Cyanobacteria bacterium P01_C01_bin.69]
MNSTTDLDRLFKAGVLAYQQGEHAEAIQAFSQLKACKSRSYRAKANMGLVRVYMSQQNWPQAKALCQQVGTSSKPALQQWSQSTLDKIAQRQAAAKSATAVGSGFQPIGDNHDLAKKKTASGFQPLAGPDERSSFGGALPSQLSGQNVPPTKVSPSKSSRPKPSQQSSPSTSPRVTKSLASSNAVVEPIESEVAPDDGVSMFHYAYLNGEEIDAEEVDGEVAKAELPADAVPAELPAVSTEGFVWPYANRLSKGRSLGKIKRSQLWFMQIGGAIAFYFLCRRLIHHVVGIINGYLNFLDELFPFGVRSLPGALNDVTWLLVITIVAMMIASPWLWDLWLRFTAGRRAFSVNSLRSHSAEAATLLSRYSRQRRWPLPTLHRLPTDIPLIFSYGFLPRNARLVVSQGLLDQLKDDELATLIAYEMSHWKSWHWPLLTVQTLITQTFLQGYWQLALWGNRQKHIIKWAVGAIATILYSVFWLMRLPSLGMSRVRTYYGDRKAAELTGNPNGLVRALSKLSFGLAASVETTGYTPILIEGLLPLMPVATDLSRQQAYGQFSLAQLFAWDAQNPLRVWMSVPDSHPPLGDRLRLMMAYAQHWKLTPEIQLAAPVKQKVKPKRGQKKGMSAAQWKQLWIHCAPYVGLVLGLGVGLLLLGVGAIAAEFEWSALDWMHKDMGLFHFCWLLGVSVGNIMRINRFFPDLSFSMGPSQDFASWICDSELLPASSVPTKLSGHVTGRPGIANWLGQDLLLRTSAGLVKLHFFSVLGPLGNVLNQQKTPRLLMGQSVQVLGWFRRSNRSWLDIDKIRLGSGSLIEAGHPLHSLGLAAIALLSGLWLLLRNSPYG